MQMEIVKKKKNEDIVSETKQENHFETIFVIIIIIE